MKKRGLALLAASLLWLSMTACQSRNAPESGVSTEPPASSAEPTESSPAAGGSERNRGRRGFQSPGNYGGHYNVCDRRRYYIYGVLADNSSAQAFAELLREGRLTIEMSDYGSMEKVGPIGQTLPANNEPITTEPGDIILYQANSLVIYYDTNSWNFTRIGKIRDVTQKELLDALGSGDVSVTFALSDDESRP